MIVKHPCVRNQVKEKIRTEVNGLIVAAFKSMCCA